MKRQATNWEKILGKHIPGKGLVSKILKELLKLNNKQANTYFKNEQDLNEQRTDKS